MRGVVPRSRMAGMVFLILSMNACSQSDAQRMDTPMSDPQSDQEFAALACGLTQYTVNQPAFEGDARPLLVVSGTVAGRIGPEWLEECPEDLSVWDRSEGFSFLIPTAAVARFGDDGEDGAFLVYLRDPME